MALPEDITTGATGHLAHHESLHDAVNAVRDAIVRPSRQGPSLTKWGHVMQLHGSIQAAIVSLTNANGTADNTIADVGGSFVQATLNNNFRDLSDKLNAVLVVLRETGLVQP